jgi:Flp pilus assembly pilin Flp
MTAFQSLLRNQAGTSSIEYAAIASLISVAAIGAIATIGSTVLSMFASIPAF